MDQTQCVTLKYTEYLTRSNNIVTLLPKSHFIIDSIAIFISSNYTFISTTKLSKYIGISLDRKKDKKYFEGLGVIENLAAKGLDLVMFRVKNSTPGYF